MQIGLDEPEGVVCLDPVPGHHKRVVCSDEIREGELEGTWHKGLGGVQELGALRLGECGGVGSVSRGGLRGNIGGVDGIDYGEGEDVGGGICLGVNRGGRDLLGLIGNL